MLLQQETLWGNSYLTRHGRNIIQDDNDLVGNFVFHGIIIN